MSNSHPVKMDDHEVQYKQNIQLLGGKSNNSVYSVLSEQQQQRYATLFGSNTSDNRLRIDESNQNNSTNLSYNANISSFNTNSQQLQAPQIFNASLNSSNLLSTQNADQSHLITAAPTDTEKRPIDNTQANTTFSRQVLNMQLPVASSDTAVSLPPQNPNYSQSNSALQYSTAASYQNGGSISLDNQQPTYVILQTPGDGENGGQPQMFLAMPTGLSGGQDQQQPYVTLQPVTVDGDLSTNGLVTDGINLQQVVMANAGGEINSEKSVGDGQQVVLSVPGQQTLLAQQSNNSQQLVTYLQPLSALGVPVSGIDQNQVIMAASDMSGNLTLHNVSGLSSKRNIISTPRNNSQVGMTPRRRLSTDPRTCEQCGRCFKYPSDLKKHLQIHTDIKKFKCDECPRTFRRLHQLNVHKRIHTGEKPYICNRCGAQFRHDSTLTMHVRTRHDHLKPFTCDGCNKKFGRMSHLRKHQRNVCGKSSARGVNVHCKYCDLQFTKKSDLKTHFVVCEKKTDRIDKDLLTTATFVCECGKEFSRVYDYKRHQLSHSDEKPYGCPQCGKMFKERSSLNKHVKRMHCSEGDGTIPIDDDGVVIDEEDDEEEMSDEDRDLSQTDIIVSLSMTGNDGTQSTTATVAAQTLARAGIITSSDGRVMTADGQPLTAAEILNFPEVAEALGINSGVQATVLDSDGNSTMIAITQPGAGNLETSEVTMDMEQGIIQDSNMINNSSNYISGDGETNDMPVIYTSENSNIYNSGDYNVENTIDASMVFKEEDDGEQYMKEMNADSNFHGEAYNTPQVEESYPQTDHEEYASKNELTEGEYTTEPPEYIVEGSTEYSTVKSKEDDVFPVQDSTDFTVADGVKSNNDQEYLTETIEDNVVNDEQLNDLTVDSTDNVNDTGLTIDTESETRKEENVST